MHTLVSPQSHGRSRRIHAAQQRLMKRSEKSCFEKLRNRELGARAGSYSHRNNSTDRFRNVQLQAEFDAFAFGDVNSWRLQYLHRRAKIVEIVACQGLIFSLAQSGACAAFDREAGKRLCYMNVASDEVIRSLFFNKHNQNLITVSVYSGDNYTSLRCRTTPLEFVRRGRPELGLPLFQAECLKWPGFVEFDDVNCKILTYSAVNKVYRVYDLRSYELLYSLADKSVSEVKISPGIMLVIHNATSSVPLKILNIEDGTVLKDFSHKLREEGKIDFIEQFNEKLLVKQEGRNLQVLDVRHGQRVEVKETEQMTPTAFIFLYENQLFLTFKHRTVAVWNFRGELVTSFEDHDLWYPDAQTNNIYITHNQSLILSYCKGKEATHNVWMPQTPEPEQDMLDGTPGSINVSSILTGKLVAKVSAVAKPQTFRERKVSDALTDVTALFFDEERNEIYTGNVHGHVHLWSN